ncbi:hypothetical protein DS2_03480 [Catenovulum agarivorans DS-2]|uniref:Mannosyl-glycoprotein endo-beta-N-acetylglucosamidase-like domain-containing protein n=1 Tax=Catenovulum agarivorans DS-2 TaxID=1328313 RepID=W7QUW9_9ALTE|nr:glucosaminidase domain-containing protein [Catenovulum agarivorans]EWH11538.1 hypothetical protein DS2_03480 [Catenovulum agarivorans DS-2]
MFKFDNIFFNSLLIAIAVLLLIDFTTDINKSGRQTSEDTDPEAPYSLLDEDIKLPSSKPSFKKYPAGGQRKKVFFDYFLPIVKHTNQQLLKLRARLVELEQIKTDLTNQQVRFVKKTADKYGLDVFSIENEQDWQVLIRRVDLVPPSLALAQAANESAWGTSRFALQGNNFFGQWCFKKGCGLVPLSRGEEQTHEVAKFSSPQHSVERYIHNLNTHPAYTQLRIMREKLRRQQNSITGIKLSEGLMKYSERGEAYIEELQEMIRFNKLDRLDR